MEGGKKIQLIVAVVAVIALGFAYGVGYYVGTEAGVEKEKKICEAQKRQIIKTLSRIVPVSRPEPVEETVVQRPKEQNEKPQPREETTAKAETQNQVAKKETNATTSATRTTKASLKSQVAEKEINATKTAQKETEEPKSKPEKQENKAPKAGKMKTEVAKGYYVQLGLFRNKENAFRLVRKLQAKGFKPKTEFSKSFVKVFIGYFADKNEALRVKRKLKNLGFESILRRKN